MPYLELADTVPLYYDDQGAGRPAVLLHGWTMNRTFWAANVEALAAENRVITVDFRGHGLSGKTDTGHTIAQYAADIHELLKRLDVTDASLVGWSMGTAVILSYVRQFGTERVRSSVFVDMSPRFLNDEGWDFPLVGGYDPTALAVFAQGMLHARPKVIKPFIAACFAEEPPADVIDAVYAETTQTPTSAALAVWYDMAYADYRDVLPNVNIPTLLLYGVHSKVFPGRLDEWLAEQLPNASIVPFENSGHALFSEESEKFNKTVLAFLGAD